MYVYFMHRVRAGSGSTFEARARPGPVWLRPGPGPARFDIQFSRPGPGPARPPGGPRPGLVRYIVTWVQWWRQGGAFAVPPNFLLAPTLPPSDNLNKLLVYHTLT